MNVTKLRELTDAIRGEMRMGITAQRLAVLVVDALDTIVQGAESEVLTGRRPARTSEALMRESALWILEDIERAIQRNESREQKLAIISTSLRRFYTRFIGG